ncbi:MAG: lysostaphin resistance A-like protein [Paraclostridium sp.]|uniref:CPBP family intramembrane glutamic endopeptidase n=1 Tax=Paraclostridium sp. TaxID=2023273 RepID=UPI003F340913
MGSKLKFNKNILVTIGIVIMIMVSLVFIISNKKTSLYGIGIILVLFDIVLIVFCISISNKITLVKTLDDKVYSKKYYLINSIYMIIGYILMKCVFINILNLCAHISTINKFESSFITRYLSEGGFLGILIIFTQIVIIGPIVEELLFRGVLLKWLLNKYEKRHLKAIIYSSAIFAFMHFNLVQGITAFGGAIILGLIYYYTKSIKLCIIGHFINNFLVIMPIPEGIVLNIVYLIVGSYLINRGIGHIKINLKL